MKQLQLLIDGVKLVFFKIFAGICWIAKKIKKHWKKIWKVVYWPFVKVWKIICLVFGWLWRKKSWFFWLFVLGVLVYGAIKGVEWVVKASHSWFEEKPKTEEVQTPSTPKAKPFEWFTNLFKSEPKEKEVSTSPSQPRQAFQPPPVPQPPQKSCAGNRNKIPMSGMKVNYPDEQAPVHPPVLDRVPQGRYQDQGGEIPVRSFSRQARWNEQAKMMQDDKGFFITPPNLLMWDGDRGNAQWVAPFDEFAQYHPQQAGRIARRYARSTLPYEYFNVEGIVRKYGRQADPYGGRGYRR